MHNEIGCPCSQGSGSVVVMIVLAAALLLAYRLIRLLMKETQDGEDVW
jgi:hypothetical protein